MSSPSREMMEVRAHQGVASGTARIRKSRRHDGQDDYCGRALDGLVDERPAFWQVPKDRPVVGQYGLESRNEVSSVTETTYSTQTTNVAITIAGRLDEEDWRTNIWYEAMNQAFCRCQARVPMGGLLWQLTALRRLETRI